MGPYVMAEDLYRYKLALVLGRGRRLKKVLKQYPTEKKFKDASINEVAEVIGVSNPNAKILQKLEKIDITYDKMVTFKSNKNWSKEPDARRVMGIDTEYLNSELDCIQYVILDNLEFVTSGFVFTNNNLASAVTIEWGINHLRDVIDEYDPDLIVGHNFNSDLTILESAYGRSLPELYYYDDTMDLLKWSNLANIIGGYSLNKAIEKVFNGDVIGLFSAYNNIPMLIEYGLKDAIYPIFLRYYTLYGEMPELNFNLKLDKIIKEENRSLLSKDTFKLNLKLDY